MKQSLNDDGDEPLVVSNKVSHKIFVKEHLLQVFVVSLYFVVSTAMPIYTNELYNYYDFPLTSTTLQVGGAMVTLIIINAVYWLRHRRDLIPKSFILNKLFLWKSLVTFPSSVLFALVIALTNVSIYKSPLDLHVLLKATNIVWIVIFAWIIEKEVPRVPVIICVVGLVAGTILISYKFSAAIKSAGEVISLNLFTFFIEAVSVVVVKKIIRILKVKEPSILAHEITLTKLWQCFLLLLLPTFLMEEFRGLTRLTQSDTIYVLVIVGVAITTIFQSTMVGLTFFSLATTLGVLSQITIVPQTVLAMILTSSKNHFVYTPLHITGVVLVLLFSVAFGIQRYFENRKEYTKRREFLVPSSGTSYGSNSINDNISDE